MKREQIIKALECCTRGRKSNEDMPCLVCPYNECNIVGGTRERQITGTCQGRLIKDALALIEALSSHKEINDIVISELRKKLDKAKHDADRYAAKIKELSEENERLKDCLRLVTRRENETSSKNLELMLENMVLERQLKNSK